MFTQLRFSRHYSINRIRFFSLFYLLLFSGILLAQGPFRSGKCGVWVKSGSQSGTNNSPLYTDRFGNTYSDEELLIYNIPLSEITANNCASTGIFNPLYQGTWTTEEQTTICQMLSDVSAIIAPGQSTQLVNILLDKTALNIGVISDGSPIFSNDDCGITSSIVLEVLNGMIGNFPVEFVHGTLHFSDNVLWHTLDQDIPGPDPVAANTFDLYSVGIHELMHVLGVYSLIGNDGSPYNDNYSYWDTYLYSGEESAYLLIEDLSGDCCDARQFNYTDIGSMPSSLQGGCVDDVSFWVNNTSIVEVADVTTGINDMDQRLSHLDRTCNSNTDHVMHPDWALGEDRRTLSSAELDILCYLGYGTTACNIDNTCVTIANDDDEFVFFLSNSNTASIALSNLLLNDVVPSQVSAQLNEECNSNLIDVVWNSNNNTFDLQFFGAGVFTFCYELIGCNNNCDGATVTVIVLDAPIPIMCEPEQDCNLLCFGDFEDFTVAPESFFLQLGIPFFQMDIAHNGGSDIRGNTPAIEEDPNGNNYLLLGTPNVNSSADFETVYLPLSQPIDPGCTVTVSFDAAYGGSTNPAIVGIPTLKFFALTDEPCSVIPYPYLCSSSEVSLACMPDVKAYCMTEQDFPTNPEGIVLPHTSLPSTLQSFSFTWQNMSTESISHVLLTPGNASGDGGFDDYAGFYGNFIDNINITNSCVNEISLPIVMTNACIGETVNLSFDVCLEGAGTTAESVTVTLDQLPMAVTIAGGDFNSNGEATKLITPGGCETFNLTLDIPQSYTAGDILSIPISATSPGTFCITTEGGEGRLKLTLEECDALLCCPPSYLEIEDESISNISNYFGQDLCIKGTLTINQNAAFVGVNVSLEQGARIVINPNVTLDIRNSHLYGCDYLWRGIIVQSSGTVNISTSKIEDALSAVEIMDKANVYVSQSIFDNNHRAIYMPSSQNPGQSIGGHLISENQFLCTDQDLKPFSPIIDLSAPISYSGIEIHGVTNNFIVSGPDLADNYTGTPVEPGNIFDGIMTGIITVDSKMDVRGAQFKDIQSITGSPLSGIGIYAEGHFGDMSTLNQSGLGNLTIPNTPTASFINCDVGISLRNVNAQIGNNRMENVNTGIGAYGLLMRDLEITRNNLHCNEKGIFINQDGPFSRLLVENNTIFMLAESAMVQEVGIHITDISSIQTNAMILHNQVELQQGEIGIFMNACNKYILANNEVNLAQDGQTGYSITGSKFLGVSCNRAGTLLPLSSNTRGFEIANTTESVYNCNTAESTNIGMRFTGGNNMATLQGSNFEFNDIGLLLDFAIFAPQSYRGNKWLGTTFTNGARINSADPFGDADLFRFKVDELDTPPTPVGISLLPPSPFPDGNNWFESIDNGGNTYVCSSELDCTSGPVPFGELTETDYHIARRETSQPAGVKYILEKSLYLFLLENPHLGIDSTSISNFKSSMASSLDGDLSLRGKEVDELLLLENSDYNQLVADQALVEQKMDSIYLLYSELSQLSNAADSSLWFNEIDLLQLQLETQSNAHAQWFGPVLTGKASKANSINQALLLLSPDSVYIQNDIDVASIYLTSHAIGDTIDIQDRNTLLSIANQCPDLGGDAVYKARSLYQLYDQDISWNDSLICANSQSFTIPPNTALSINENLELWPNPANGYVNIMLPKKLAGRIEIQVYDLWGRSHYDLILDEYNPIIEVDLNHLQQGAYFVHLLADKHIIGTKKLIISK